VKLHIIDYICTVRELFRAEFYGRKYLREKFYKTICKKINNPTQAQAGFLARAPMDIPAQFFPVARGCLMLDARAIFRPVQY